MYVSDLMTKKKSLKITIKKKQRSSKIAHQSFLKKHLSSSFLLFIMVKKISFSTRKICFALGIIVLWCIVFAIRVHRHSMNLFLLEDIILSPQETSLAAREDRCTENGEVCLYNNICYNITSKHWETSNEIIVGQPLLNNVGMNNRHEISKETDSRLYKFSQCNEKFQPVYSEIKVDSEKVLSVHGTTYFICGWVDHFGHILMNMVTPAYHALVNIGLKEKLHNIKYLVQNRSKCKEMKNIWKFLHFLTGGNQPDKRVLSFSSLLSQASSNEQTHMCFDELVVGMYEDSLIGVGIGDVRENHTFEEGQLNPMRDHLNSLYPATMENINAALQETLVSKPTIPDSSPNCTITLLERRGARTIINHNETLDVINEVFDPTKWNFQRVSFESGSSSIRSQYLTLKSTMVQISTTGSGSHLSMFLPHGGVDIQIKFLPTKHNNDELCAALPEINCFTVDPPKDFVKNKTFRQLKRGNIMVDLDGFRIALQKAHDHMSSRCQNASGTSLRT